MPRLLALALCLAAAGCDSQTCPADCAPPPEPAPPVVVDGIDLTALFAPPTAAERDTVAARAVRAVEPAVVSVEATPVRTDPDATRLLRLDLRGASGETLAYGLARVPAVGAAPGTLRTVVLLPEAPGDVSEADFYAGPEARGVEQTTVQIALAYRGATVAVRDASGVVRRFTSAAAAEPYRTDVADLLALTERLSSVPRTDPARLAAVGVGRGGAVALLAAERAQGRFAGVGTISAPTTLFDATVLADARRLIEAGVRSRLPSSDALFAPLAALRAGQISLAEARLRMLALSPIALADRLPTLVAVHAAPDAVVPTAHLDRLAAEGDGTTGAPRRFLRIEDVLHEDVGTATDARAPIVFFLIERL